MFAKMIEWTVDEMNVTKLMTPTATALDEYCYRVGSQSSGQTGLCVSSLVSRGPLLRCVLH